MYELAIRYGDEPVFLREIARTHRISEKYLSKLVIPLRGVGLIRSHRGAHGGYTLARDPRTISAREIVQVLEGDVAPAPRPRKGRGPEPADMHPTDTVWVLLERTIAETLDSVTLDGLVQAAGDRVLNYQI